MNRFGITPNEARRAINELTWRGEFFEPARPRTAMNLGGPIARAVHNLAERDGLSGEDRYALLAYHALRELDKLSDLLLQQVSASLHPPMIIVDQAGADAALQRATQKIRTQDQ